MPARRTAMFELHLATLLLAMAGVLAKFTALGEPAIVLGRSAIAAPALVAILALRGRRLSPGSPRAALALLVTGVLLGGHWLTFFLAIRTATLAVGILVLFTFPVITALLEPLAFRERLRWRTVINGVVVLVGLYFVVGEFDPTSDAVRGAGWAIASALIYTARNLITRRLAGDRDGALVMGWQVAAAAVVMLPLVLIDPPTVTGRDVALLLVLGLICTALAHTMFVVSIRHFGAATASIVITLEPVYATLAAIPLFGEMPDMGTWAGGAIILAAVVHEAAFSARPEVTANPT